MMKKLLIFMLVLEMASLAGASVIDAVISPQMNYQAGGIGGVQQYADDSTHAGTSGDPILVGETLHLAFVLNWVDNSFPGGDYPSYDGYALSGMDFTLTASGAGSLMVNANKKNVDVWGAHTDWTFLGSPAIASNVLDTGPYASMADTTGVGVTLGIGTLGVDDEPVLWNMYVKGDSAGTITLTWGIATAPGEYYDYFGDGIVTDPVAKLHTLGGLGGVSTIYVVPEPMTVVLLGFGGLLLRRRRIRRG